MRAFLADAGNHRQQFERTQMIRPAAPWPYAVLEWKPPEEAPPTARHLIRLVIAHTGVARAAARQLAGHDDPLRCG